MGAKSTVAKARSDSPSVRTTIPEQIVKAGKIQVGDVLDWETVNSGGKIEFRVKKLQ